MNSMIERVARAIFESRAFHGSDPRKPAWVDRGNSFMQDDARMLARAAIAAMRGPTDAMVSAADATGSRHPADDLYYGAMIDAALTEPEQMA